jgi:hypothetical protein
VLYEFLQLLESKLDAFHLQDAVALWISIAVGALGLLLSQAHAAASERVEHAAQAAALDRSMASSTPRAVAELDPHDLGVRRSATPGPYVRRDADDRLDDAFGQQASIVLTGPARCGKSRTAVACLRRHAPDAVLLAPEHAAGLRAMLSDDNHEPLRRTIAHGPRAVLWLDDLERFLDGLDLDALDAFQRPELIAREPGRAARVLGRLSSRRRDERERAETPPTPAVQLLATLRDDALAALSSGTDEASRTGRRLLGRLQGIYLDDTLSPAEQTRFGREYAHAPPAATTVSALFGSGPVDDWAPNMTWTVKPLGRPHWRANVVTITCFVLTLGCAGLALAAAHRDGWTKAPPAKDQIRAVERSLKACQTGKPSTLHPTNGRHLVLLVDSSACPGPDELRYYRFSRDRLTELFRETPRDGGDAWSVSCIGPRDRCSLPFGDESLVAAAFHDPSHDQLLPFLVYPSASGDTAPRLQPLVLPAPPKTGDPDARIEQRTMALALRAGAPADASPAGRHPCDEPGTLCGHPAESVLALGAAKQHRPPLVAAAYLQDGTLAAPRRVRVLAWKLEAAAHGSTHLATRERCLIFVDGVLTSSVPVSPAGTAHAALAKAIAARATRVVC